MEPMLMQANMPNLFWAAAMKTATYLRNRLPNSTLEYDIPYASWSYTTCGYWNFQRKAIVHSANLTFIEMEFPERSEFDDPDETYDRSLLKWPPPADENKDDDDTDDENTNLDSDLDNDEDLEPPSSEEFIDTSSTVSSRAPHVIYDEIIVESLHQAPSSQSCLDHWQIQLPSPSPML